MKFFPNFMLREMMAWYVPWAAGRAGRHLSLEPRVRRIRLSLHRRESSRVVLPVHVPDPQDDPVQVWIVDGEVLGVLGCSLAGLLV